MRFLAKTLLLTLGYIWSLPYAVFAILCLLTVYFPRSIRWSEGAFDVVVRWALIPEGMDRTGNGKLGDPGDFRTGAQTHAFFIFSATKEDRDKPRLRVHERTHVRQGMIFGPFYPIIYIGNFLWNRLRGQSGVNAYLNIWFEKQARAAESTRIG